MMVFLLGRRVVAEYHAPANAYLATVIEREVETDARAGRRMLIGNKTHAALAQIDDRPFKPATVAL